MTTSINEKKTAENQINQSMKLFMTNKLQEMMATDGSCRCVGFRS